MTAWRRGPIRGPKIMPRPMAMPVLVVGDVVIP